MKNKLTKTRGEREWDNRGKKGKSPQGTCIKDPWTKPKEGGIVGGEGSGVGKWRQLYLNNNKNKK